MPSTGRLHMAVAGLGDGDGKTLIALALAARLRRDGAKVQAYKQGADPRDTAWLSLVSGRPARNLDVFLMGEGGVRAAYAQAASEPPDDEPNVTLVEGAGGLLDAGPGPVGEPRYTGAALFERLDLPVILVVDAQGSGRSAAAPVAGILSLAPELRIAGVVLNRLADESQARAAGDAVEDLAGIPVMGLVPRFSDGVPLLSPLNFPPLAQSAHESGADVSAFLDYLTERVAPCLDLDGIIAACTAPVPTRLPVEVARLAADPVRIGVFTDGPFGWAFYDNTAALRAAGALIVPIHALTDRALPELDGLYLGPGLAPADLPRVAANTGLLAAVRAAAAAGVPIVAEGDGIVLLGRAVITDARTLPAAGVLPVRFRRAAAESSGGYDRLTTTVGHPFLRDGLEVAVYDDHRWEPIDPPEADAVRYGLASRCAGALHQGFDGLVDGPIIASRARLHARGTPGWAPGFVALAQSARARRRATARFDAE